MKLQELIGFMSMFKDSDPEHDRDRILKQGIDAIDGLLKRVSEYYRVEL